MSKKLRRLPPITPDVVARFWPKVAKGGENECWLWTAMANSEGRGMLKVADSQYLAPRISWAIHSGEDPYPLDILHECPDGDNPRCVNPRHLKPGTQSENWARALAMGQIPSKKGTFYKRKLTHEQEDEIRRDYKPRRVTMATLAARYGVSGGTIARIVNGKCESEPLPGHMGRGGRHILSDADKLAALAEYARGATVEALAEKYGVGWATMNRSLNDVAGPETPSRRGQRSRGHLRVGDLLNGPRDDVA